MTKYLDFSIPISSWTPSYHKTLSLNIASWRWQRLEKCSWVLYAHTWILFGPLFFSLHKRNSKIFSQNIFCDVFSSNQNTNAKFVLICGGTWWKKRVQQCNHATPLIYRIFYFLLQPKVAIPIAFRRTFTLAWFTVIDCTVAVTWLYKAQPNTVHSHWLYFKSQYSFLAAI